LPKAGAPESLIVAMLVSLLLCLSSFARADDGPMMITVVAEVYQTKRAAAEPFLRKESVDAAQFLSALQKLAQGFNSTTTLIKLPALTVKSGQRGLVQGKDSVLEAEGVLAPDGQTVTLNAVLKVGVKTLTTAVDAKFGGTIFLGALDGAPQDSVQLAFIRVLKQQ